MRKQPRVDSVRSDREGGFCAGAADSPTQTAPESGAASAPGREGCASARQPDLAAVRAHAPEHERAADTDRPGSERNPGAERGIAPAEARVAGAHGWARCPMRSRPARGRTRGTARPWPPRPPTAMPARRPSGRVRRAWSNDAWSCDAFLSVDRPFAIEFMYGRLFDGRCKNVAPAIAAWPKRIRHWSSACSGPSRRTPAAAGWISGVPSSAR